MNYDELYQAWKREKESAQLQKLSKDFYERLAEYIKILKEEQRMIDEKSIRAKLLVAEHANVKRLATELLQLRHTKIATEVSERGLVPTEVCAREEESLSENLASATDTRGKLLKKIFEGRVTQTNEVIAKPKKILVRFLQPLPPIMGADMKSYGPFKQEDLALLPSENVEALLKQGIVTKVEAEK